MNLTFACICGANYEYEFEPVDGKLPGEVRCPSCGADATPIARRKLAQALAAAPPPPAPKPVVPVEEKPVVPTHCAKHPKAPVAMFCFVCKRPMCADCMEQYGFVCSTYCRHRGEELRLDIPVYEKQLSVVAEQQTNHGKTFSILFGVVVVAVLAIWGWYVGVASRPHPEFRLRLPNGEHPEDCRFIAPHQILLTTDKRAASYDVENGKTLWSTALPAHGTVVHVSDLSLWVRSADLLLRLNRQTGQETGRFPIPGHIQSVLPATSWTTVISDEAGATRLVQIAMPSGAVMTNMTGVYPPDLPSAEKVALNGDSETPLPRIDTVRTEFLPAGPNIAELGVRLLKANIVDQATMKKANSNESSTDMNLANTAALREDVLNDLQRQRTGGIRKLDESTYAVTLRRHFGQSDTVWTGEMTGRPEFFALTTVDILLAGQQFVVFNKNNQELWRGKLTYGESPRVPAESTRHHRPPPCLESRNSLYFIDQGVLTAYELSTGGVRWRLPSVGISKLTMDARGLLYVSTTSAGLEALQYADQINIREKIVPVIMKVDPSSGKILWQSRQLGDTCYASGPYLYFTRTQGSSIGVLDLAAGLKPAGAEHFRVIRVDPDKGHQLWEQYQPSPPLVVDFQGTRVLLLNRDGPTVLKFFSF